MTYTEQPWIQQLTKIPMEKNYTLLDPHYPSLLLIPMEEKSIRISQKLSFKVMEKKISNSLMMPQLMFT